MDIILRLVFLIVAFNAIVVLTILFYYLKAGRHHKITVDFEEYLACLSRDAKITDPCILVGGKWVKTNAPSEIPPNH